MADLAAGADERTPVRSWWMLTVLALFYALSFLDRNAMSVLAEEIRRDLDLTDTQMSLLLGPAFTLFYAIFGIPLGWASDRLPRRWVVFFGVALWSLCATGSGLLRTLPALFAARAGVGVGEAALMPSAYGLLADGFPRRRLGTALAIYQSAIYIGTAGGFALIGLIVGNADAIRAAIPVFTDLSTWQVALILTGLPGLFLSLLVFTFSEPARKAPVEGAAAPGDLVGFLKREPKLMFLLLIGFGVTSMSFYALTAWVPAYIQRRFGLGAAEFGPMLSVIGLLNAAILTVKGGVMDWLFRRGRPDAHVLLYTWLLAASSPVVAAAFFVSDVTLFMVAWGVIQIVTLSYSVFYAATVQLIAPAAVRGRMTALFMFVFAMFGAIGPVLIGLATDHILRDPMKLGVALGVMLGVCAPATFFMLRAALPHLRRVIGGQIAAEADAAVAAPSGGAQVAGA